MVNLIVEVRFNELEIEPEEMGGNKKKIWMYAVVRRIPRATGEQVYGRGSAHSYQQAVDDVRSFFDKPAKQVIEQELKQVKEAQA